MFEIKNVSKEYNGAYALKNVSFKMGKGLNFITGASGSGKTTLLNIISGLEENFEGEVSCGGKNVKTLTSKEKSFFYNTIFGFVWQDANLIENATVLENILLPQYLKKEVNQSLAEKILKDLNLYKLAMQKVKELSGGQKQRVAIARELMKNPKILIADEPTSALDKKTSKEIMDILRTISKHKTVIIVTHDTSLILPEDFVFEIDKGELVKKAEVPLQENKIEVASIPKLSFKSAISMAISTIKNKKGRFLISLFTLMIATILLLTTTNKSIENNSQEEFTKLINTYGEALLDIGLYNSFFDAAGTDGSKSNKPSGEVNQNLSGLYDKYAEDKRIAFISYLQAFDHIKITLEGKEYPIQGSGNAPSINQLLEGNMPMGKGNEVVIPQSFAKKIGLSAKEAIGKEITFHCSIVNWDTGKPIWKDASSKATIVGVMDTTVKYEYLGNLTEHTIDDSFLFSKSALESMQKQAGKSIEESNFLLRAKTPEDMISIKDELNKKGMVPIGRFELVEDLVRLNQQSTEQSGSSTIIISILAIILLIAISIITAWMRKREYAIYKTSGFHNLHLSFLSLIETIISMIATIILGVVASPFLDSLTQSLFGMRLMNLQMLSNGILIMTILGVLTCITTCLTFVKINISTTLKAGEK